MWYVWTYSTNLNHGIWRNWMRRRLQGLEGPADFSKMQHLVEHSADIAEKTMDAPWLKIWLLRLCCVCLPVPFHLQKRGRSGHLSHGHGSKPSRTLKLNFEIAIFLSHTTLYIFANSDEASCDWRAAEHRSGRASRGERVFSTSALNSLKGRTFPLDCTGSNLCTLLNQNWTYTIRWLGGSEGAGGGIYLYIPSLIGSLGAT